MEHKPYITTTQEMSGYFAVYMWWNPEGFYEPSTTGFGRYITKDKAEIEAKQWALNEGFEYKP